jgi:hypothetical protein
MGWMPKPRNSLKHSVLLLATTTSYSSDRFSRVRERAGVPRRIPSLVGTACGPGEELGGLSGDGHGGSFDSFQDLRLDGPPGPFDSISFSMGVPAFKPPVSLAPSCGGGLGPYRQVDGDLPVSWISQRRTQAMAQSPMPLCSNSENRQALGTNDDCRGVAPSNSGAPPAFDVDRPSASSSNRRGAGDGQQRTRGQSLSYNGGGRGIYRNVDGDLPGAPRTVVQEQPEVQEQSDIDAPRFMPGADFHVGRNDTLGVAVSKPPVALAPSLADDSHATCAGGEGGHFDFSWKWTLEYLAAMMNATAAVLTMRLTSSTPTSRDTAFVMRRSWWHPSSC